MYESHFGFRRKPFRAATAQSQYFGSTGLQRVLGPISYCLRTGQGIALLTAPAGLGKSTVLRHLVRMLEGSGKVVLLPGLQAQTPEGLLSTIAAGAASEPQKSEWKPTELRGEAGLRDRVVSVCQRAAQLWGPTIVLIDDAHVVCDDVFHELRFLADCLDDDQPLFRIGLAGTLKLEEKLTSPALSDFGQRVRCHQFLESLRPEESIAYLKWHIESVGGKLEHAFEGPAVEFIVVAADGVPRCLNQLADESLLLAYYANRTIVDLATARTALESLRHLPLEWSDPEPELTANLGDDARGESDSIIEIAGLSNDEHSVATGTDALEDAIDTSADVSSHFDPNTSGTHHGEDTRGSSVSVLEFGESGVRDDASDSGSADDEFDGDEIDAEGIGEDAEFADGIEGFSAVRDDAIDAPVTDKLDDDACEADDDACEADNIASAAFSDSLEQDRARLEKLLAEKEGSQSSRTGSRFVVSVPDSWDQHPTQEMIEEPAEHVPQLTLEDTNPVPVFDRYTWNALERDVPVGSPRAATELEFPPGRWPPAISSTGSGAAIPISDEAIDEHSGFVTRDSRDAVSDIEESATDCEFEFVTGHENVNADSGAEFDSDFSDSSDAESEQAPAVPSADACYPSNDWSAAATQWPDQNENRRGEETSTEPQPLDTEVNATSAKSGDQVPDVSSRLDDSRSGAIQTVPVFGTAWSDRADVVDDETDSAEPAIQPGTDEFDDEASGPDVERSFFTLNMMVSTLEASESRDASGKQRQLGEPGVTAKSSEEVATGVFSTSESVGPNKHGDSEGFSETLNPATESENAETRLFRLRQDSVLSENDGRHPLQDNSHLRNHDPVPQNDLFSNLFTRIIGRGNSDNP